MPSERLLNTLAAVSILFAAGLFVTLTSFAALNAASLSAGASGTTCGKHGCISIASGY